MTRFGTTFHNNYPTRLKARGKVITRVVVVMSTKIAISRDRSTRAAEGGEGAYNYHVRPGAIKIQIQAQYFTNMCLLEMVIAIYIHGLPRPVPRLNLYFDGTQVTRSFAAFGGSYAPVKM